MLVQFAQMGAAYSAARYGVADPTVALLSIGEEPTKGTPLVKEAHGLLTGAAGVRFTGNVEGRDLLPSPADVIVTDGFTDDETRAASEVLLPHLLPLAAEFDPDNTGGAMLLGVAGVCVISHGSSTAVAILNAVRVAYELAKGGRVDHLAGALSAS
jgi:glycerol-3-phosphate acyltransferase PlsX